MSTNAYVRFATSSSSIEYANAGHASWKADHEERDHRCDAHGERVDADLALSLEHGDEEAVDEVDRPQRERRRDERQSELVHRAQQLAVELETELVAPVAEQHEVDGERAR